MNQSFILRIFSVLKQKHIFFSILAFVFFQTISCQASSNPWQQERIYVEEILESGILHCNLVKARQLMNGGSLPRKDALDGPCPLTRSGGITWQRQRAAFCNSTAGLQEKSIQAAHFALNILKQDLNQKLQKDEIIQVDLKHLLEEAISSWLVMTFAGSPNSDLQNAFLRHWRPLRGKKRQKLHVIELLEEINKCNSGLIGCIKSHKSSREFLANEILPNALHAMIAAFETTLTTTFWSLLEIDENLSQLQMNTLRQMDTQELLDELSVFKHAAAGGESISPAAIPRSKLGRCIAATLRVYPPVWGICYILSQLKKSEYPGVKRIHCHVLPANGNDACNRRWDPDLDHSQPLATFGVGKRHCPGGTTALMAVGIIVQGLISEFSISEVIKGNAVKTSYLSPTLNMQGPQLFSVSRI